jgi:hypothetical protein
MTPTSPTGRGPGRAIDAYTLLLQELHAVADDILGRLRDLRGDLPGGLVEEVERLYRAPERDRRRTVRVTDPPLHVTVKADGLPEGGDTAVRDHCPRGLAVRLPCPAAPGSFLRVRLPLELGGSDWVTVEVKHCRKEEEGWIAGCELLAEQPPL